MDVEQFFHCYEEDVDHTIAKPITYYQNLLLQYVEQAIKEDVRKAELKMNQITAQYRFLTTDVFIETGLHLKEDDATKWKFTQQLMTLRFKN